LEYKASVQKTPWLPRAALDTKLVREVQSGAAGSNQNSHEVVVAVAESGQLGKTVPVVDRGLVVMRALRPGACRLGGLVPPREG
jgi:hypothetical protein